MSKISRVGDIGVGICPCHITPVQYTTVFSDGCSIVKTNGMITTIVGTIGVSSCGHPTIAITGSNVINLCNKQVHRVGDVGSNCGPYTSISGSEDVDSG